MRKLIFDVAVPKGHTIFRFEIPQPAHGIDTIMQEGEGESEQMEPDSLIFELHGSQFENRAPERATRKFKQRNMTDL